MSRSTAAANGQASKIDNGFLIRAESSALTPVDHLPNSDLGARIHHLRQYRGLTQKALATLLEVSASTISLWERNRRHPEKTKMADVAAALRTSLDDLVGEHAASATACADEILSEFSLNDRLLLTADDYEAICAFIELHILRRRNEQARNGARTNGS
jgi:transcriptional regulator with XRE-family HTH domain